MELEAWNEWINLADSMSEERVDAEIAAIGADEELAFVEKNLRLGYLYYKKDFIAMATKCFQSISAEIQLQKENANTAFFEGNEGGLKIYRATIDCHIVDPMEECANDCCTCGAPGCCCLGAVTGLILTFGSVLYFIFGEESANAIMDECCFNDSYITGIEDCCDHQCYDNDSFCSNCCESCNSCCSAFW